MNADLSTEYVGLALRNPVVASSTPMTGELDSLHRLVDAGVSAVVLPSLFEEQLAFQKEMAAVTEAQAYSSPEALSYFPKVLKYRVQPRKYIGLIGKAKRELAVPVIASLNGQSRGGWVEYAKWLEDAGADAIELNVYHVPTDPMLSAAEVECRYVGLVETIREAISVPIAVKVGAQFSCLPNFVAQLVRAGADGIVLFNRYLEPDIDLGALEVRPELNLSTPNELRLPLRWIAILRDQTRASLGATSGLHTAEDVIKLLLVGADACFLASALLRHGPEHAAGVIRGLQDWLDGNGYESVRQLKGSMSYVNCAESSEIERVNYMKAIVSYTGAE